MTQAKGRAKVMTIYIKSLQNRLLKVCYVPATSAGLPRVSFFFSFLSLLLQPLTVLMKQTRQALRAIKQSIYLDVYGYDTVIVMATLTIIIIIYSIGFSYNCHL